MIAINNESGFWPTRAQSLILRAALLKGDQALIAWQEWLRTIDIEVLDFGSHRMIPQLYHNLLEHGVQDPLLERFKGVYRYYLYKNEILLHKTAIVLRTLREAQIDTIMLKGCALVPLYYKESGLRPMQDADLLVHVQDAPRAMVLLRQLGYCPPTWAEPSPESGIPIRHSLPFSDQGGRQIDLHWYFLWECHHAGETDHWEQARPTTLRGISSLTVSPTDQLLHTCWHGARWNEVPPIRWIADAMAILNESEREIDWERIVEKARRHRISLPIKDSLVLLRSLLDASVPDDVIASLALISVTRMDRIGYEAAANPLALKETRRILALLVCDYLWLTSSTSKRPALFAYIRFLQAKWHVERLWLLPFYLLFRSIRRLLRTAAGMASSSLLKRREGRPESKNAKSSA